MGKTNQNGNTQEKGQETYEGFTLSLALMDAVPVILFVLMGMTVAHRFGDPLFSIGILLMTAGGACKVLWKLLLAVCHQDVHFLNRPLFIVLMPAGFLLAVLSVILSAGQIDWERLCFRIFSFPAVLFFVLGILGIAAMTIFFKIHDKNDPRNNWVEQLTNSFAQLMFLIGVLLV